MRGLKQAATIVASVALAAALLAGSAAADYSSSGLIDPTSNPSATLVVPAEDGSCTAANFEAYYVTKSFTARAAGVHRVQLTHNSQFPTGIIVYDGGFDPSGPLSHCVRAAVVPGSPNPTTGTLDLAGARGHHYTVVVAAIATTDYSLVIDEPDGAAAGTAVGTGTRFVRLPSGLVCSRLAMVATWTSRAKEVRSAVFRVDGEQVDLVRLPLPRDRSGVPVGLGDVTVKATLKLTNGKTVSARRGYLSC